MERVRGVGGVFLRCSGDRKALLEWYRDHLGIEFEEEWGGRVFDDSDATRDGLTWSIFKSDTSYFGRPEQQAMVNYKVDNLAAMLEQLRDAGVAVDDKTDESDFGKFGWATDPEGNRFELWQAPDRTIG